MKMGERLKALRLARNISQEEVARQIGITRSAYSHYEINNRQPVYETLIKLAAFFDVSLDYIIGGTDCKKGNNPAEAPDPEIWKLLQHMDPEQRKQSIQLMSNLIGRDSSQSKV
jgi:transcriptional regulator with XRE-family HTH domain